MRDQKKWNIAIGRLAAFVSNLPHSPDEGQISHYHDIIKLLQEGCGQDLSQFRIAPDQVKTASATTASSGGRWQTRHPKKIFVEFAYLRGQVQGLIDYLKIIQGSRPH
jgi:hypothetical protein